MAMTYEPVVIGERLPRLATPARAGTRVLTDAWIAAACCAALALHLVNLDAAPLWYDEVISAEWIRLPWAAMVQSAAADKHPPLYFLLLKAWTLLAGDSPWSLRLPSVLAVLVAVPALAAAAAHLKGRTAARWAAWLTACSPFLLEHGQEARMYAIAIALGSLQLLLVARLVRGAAPRLGMTFVAVTIAALATHYYMGLSFAGLVLGLVLVRVPPRQWDREVLAAGVGALAAAIAAAMLASHVAAATYDTGVLALPGALWGLVGGYTLLPTSGELHAHGVRAALPFLPLAVAAAVPVGALVVGGAVALDRPARRLLLALLAVTVGGPLLLQLMLGVGLHPRYFAAAFPPLIALLAVGATARAGRVAAGLVLVVMGIGAARHFALPEYGREDVRGATAWLATRVPRDAALTVTSAEMADLARFYWPERRVELYPPRRVVVQRSDAAAWAAGLPAEGPRTFYVIGREWLSDPHGALLAAVRHQYASCGVGALLGIRILCLAPRRTAARADAPSAPVQP
jgi:hypothetical protein